MPGPRSISAVSLGTKSQVKGKQLKQARAPTGAISLAPTTQTAGRSAAGPGAQSKAAKPNKGQEQQAASAAAASSGGGQKRAAPESEVAEEQQSPAKVKVQVRPGQVLCCAGCKTSSQDFFV